MQRAIRFLFACWFLVVLVAPEAVHACALHDGPAASGHSGHEGHAMAEPDGAGSSDSASDLECSCPDDCANASSVATISFSVREIPAPVVETTLRVPESGIVSLALPPPFLLPFANGPPNIPA